ncbi:MAG TPA: family 16 glycosylhydrolase, partial [Solirubrobacteraceae bacterium]
MATAKVSCAVRVAIAVLAIVAASASAGVPAAQALPPGEWSLALNEEFTTAGVNTALWTKGWQHEGTSEISGRCISSSNTSQMGNGYLNLGITSNGCGAAVESNPADGVSGHLGFSFSYGYVEWRAYVPGIGPEGLKCPKGGCLPDWPALWSLPESHVTEIDTMEGLETLGQACFHFHHFAATDENTGECVTGSYAGWHTYGADWEPGSVTYYYDGVKVGKISSPYMGPTPQYLVMGFQTPGPTCCHQPYQAPDQMVVDYVKVWQHPKISFQANTGHLWTYTPGEPLDTGLAMKAGTGPSLTTLEHGQDLTAFQGGADQLWLDGPEGANNELLTIDPGSSPDIAALGSGSPYIVALNKESTHHLWVFVPTEADDETIVMAPGTSPSITGLAGGPSPYVIAAQGSNEHLWLRVPAEADDEGLPMSKGTSPSVTALGTSYIVAYQCSNGDLCLFLPTEHDDEGLGMAAGTSPSITGLVGGGYAAAFQANTHNLYVFAAGKATNTGLSMNEGTSPSITALEGGSYQITFQTSGGNLET